MWQAEKRRGEMEKARIDENSQEEKEDRSRSDKKTKETS